MNWTKVAHLGYYFELTWADSQEFLSRFGGHRDLFTDMGKARDQYKALTKKYPYVDLSKVTVDSEANPLYDQLILSHNIYNW